LDDPDAEPEPPAADGQHRRLLHTSEPASALMQDAASSGPPAGALVPELGREPEPERDAAPEREWNPAAERGSARGRKMTLLQELQVVTSEEDKLPGADLQGDVALLLDERHPTLLHHWCCTPCLFPSAL
jgi:hypothetical protein